LIRPGRVDIKQYIGHVTACQLRGMFINFYPDAKDNLADEFTKNVLALNSQFSAAQIQGFFMLHKNEPNKAIENIAILKS
jgi:chaperone BCS1